MRYAAARLLVLLLVLAQVAIGRAGGPGDVLCLGHAGGPTQEPAAASSCCHDHGAPAVPVEPHEHDCPCIDVPIAIGAARIDPTTGDDPALAAAVTLAALPPSLILTGPERPHLADPGRPPGLPPPGLRTTRLLI